MHFSKIQRLVTHKDEKPVLEALQSVAVLLKGCWVVKSSLLYENNDRMKLTRDYLLGLFHDNDFVYRKDFAKATKLAPETAKNMLANVAKLVDAPNMTSHSETTPSLYLYEGKPQAAQFVDTNHGGQVWRLKAEPDIDFMSSHPEIVAKAERGWRERIPEVQESLAKLLEEVTVVPVANPKANQFGGNSAKEQLESFFAEMFKKFGVCNIGFLKQHLTERQKTKDPHNMLLNVTDQFFQHTLKQIAGHLHGAYYAKSLNNPSMDKFRDVVLEVFAKQISLKKQDIKEHAMKKLGGEDIPQQNYIKILKEIAYCKNTQWIFKSGNGTEQ